MKRENKPTKEAYFNRYIVRMIKRITKIVFWSFILFLLVMAIIWLVPKIWSWAIG